MAFSSLKMASISPTYLSGVKPSYAELAPRKVRPFQVRCKENSELETPRRLCITRRDALICLTTLSVSGIGVSSSPEIAEARITKKEMRQKIKEKLDMLREKAGLSKRKKKDKEKSPSPPPSTKENILPLEPSPLPLPIPPQAIEKSLVEVTLL